MTPRLPAAGVEANSTPGGSTVDGGSLESPRAVRGILTAAGWGLVGIGSGVLLGWHSDVPWLRTFGFEAPPTRPNTAVCLLLYGASLLLLARGSFLGVRLAAGAGLLISVATMAEHFFGFDLGIDDVFGVWPPGQAESARMPLNSVVCLTLNGVVLMLLAGRHARWLRAFVPIVASIVWSIAAVAFAGHHLVGLAAARAWGPFGAMAPVTAVALLVLPVACMVILWRGKALEPSGPRWLPVPIVCGVMVMSLMTAHALAVSQRDVAQRWLRVFVQNLAADIQRELEQHASDLRVLAAQSAAQDDAERRRGVTAFKNGHATVLAIELRSPGNSRVSVATNAEALALLRKTPDPVGIEASVTQYADARVEGGRTIAVVTAGVEGAGEGVVVLSAVDFEKLAAPYQVQQAMLGRRMEVFAGTGEPAVGSLGSTAHLYQDAGVQVPGLRLSVRLTPAADGPVARSFNSPWPLALAVIGAIFSLLLGCVVALAQATADRADALRRDIARRVEVERELRATHDSLEEAQRVARIGSWRWDIATGAVQSTPEVWRILGLPQDTQPKQCEAFLEYAHEDDRDRLQQALAAALGGAPLSLHCRVVRPDGSLRITHAQGDTLRGPAGEVMAMTGTFQDVTEERTATEAVARSEHLLNLVLDTLPVGVIISGADGEVQRVNPAAHRIWNTGPLVGREEYGPHKGWFADTGRPIAPGEWAIARALTTGEAILGDIVDIECFDGARKTISNSAVPFRGPSGEVLGVIVLEEDITERRRSEVALADRTCALERSNQELEQFAYVASHDLQEPLRMVASYTQLLGRRYGPQLDDKAREFIHFAVDGAQRMQRLINDLLAFSRVGTRGTALVRADANDVASQALANLQMAIAEAGALIDLKVLPMVRADEGQLAQVFQNLIANAIKFRGDDPPRISISAHADGDMVQFAVADNGIGIAPAHAERIFVLFQRLHGAGKYPGTGMGLAICKKIVERHGGRIWVGSARGPGSTFCFTIPAGASPGAKRGALEVAA